jgi:Xaa-Pro aminopeptidase
MGKDADMLLVTMLDDIAWFLNLRGNDISYNPVFFAYLIFHKEGETYKVDLFMNKDKASDPEVMKYLGENHVSLYGYQEVDAKIAEYAAEGKKISIHKDSLCHKFVNLLTTHKYEMVNQEESILPLLKCKKNETQMQGMRDCNVKDCAAIMKYFAFLEEELRKPDHGLDEFSGARKVEEYRTFGELYKGPSFDTISSIGPNGAVIHYKPKQESA